MSMGTEAASAGRRTLVTKRQQPAEARAHYGLAIAGLKDIKDSASGYFQEVLRLSKIKTECCNCTCESSQVSSGAIVRVILDAFPGAMRCKPLPLHIALHRVAHITRLAPSL